MKEVEKIEKQVQSRIIESVGQLADDPFTMSTKLKMKPSLYRLRVGNYRVIFKIDSTSRLITIYKIGHRRNVYKK